MYGKIEDFSGNEEGAQYIEQLEFFFTANTIADSEKNADRQKAILLSIISSKTNSLLRDLIRTVKSADNTYKEIVNVSKIHFQPRTSVMHYKFNTCTRNSNKTVADYVAI